jgi:hypothetical protein
MNSLFKKLLILIGLFLVCAAGTYSQPTDEGPAKANGTITGVVNTAAGDLPSNTIVYASVFGASVPPHSVVINSDGTFKITNLEIGVYRVWAGAPGFVPDQQQTTPDMRGVYHTGDSVNITLRKGGVITGKVTSSSNAPAVNVPVRAFRIRDELGKPIEIIASGQDRLADDRGVYRIYGLVPGTYIVSTGGTSRFFGGFSGSAYDQHVPTFAPSGTRDTAAEVTIRSGEEVSVDIQYRGEPGHAISGTVAGIVQAPSGMLSGASVMLTDVKSRMSLSSSQASSFTNHAFAFYGLPDGEYELVAQQFSQTRDVRASEPKRIKIRGADVTGVSLTVASLPMIKGRVILDGSLPADCIKRRATAFQETLVTVRRQKQATKSTEVDARDPIEAVPLTSVEQFADAVPDENGDFLLRNLRYGTYRVQVQLPSAAWYLGSVTLGSNAKGADPKVISEGINLKTQSLSGLTITLNEGAAGLYGQLTAAEGERLPQRVVVYLVPAEKVHASNLLRYFETLAGTNGRFSLANVPPGEYLVVALNAAADRPSGTLVRQDSTLRATVTQEAERVKHSVTLKPCERIENFELPFSPPTEP